MRCATSRTVPGSIPNGITGFFSDISHSDRTIGMGLNQPLLKMSTRNIPGVKAAGAWGWQPHHFFVSNIMKYGSLNLLWATPGLLRDSLPFFHTAEITAMQRAEHDVSQATRITTYKYKYLLFVFLAYLRSTKEHFKWRPSRLSILVCYPVR